jgi:hypothetical protein
VLFHLRNPPPFPLRKIPWTDDGGEPPIT